MSREGLITVIELAARVDHLLLAKNGELIASKRILIVLDKLVAFAVGSDRGIDCFDRGVVIGSLGCSWVASSMAREDLNESDLTLSWYSC
jgi:hypothetical protein